MPRERLRPDFRALSAAVRDQFRDIQSEVARPWSRSGRRGDRDFLVDPCHLHKRGKSLASAHLRTFGKIGCIPGNDAAFHQMGTGREDPGREISTKKQQLPLAVLDLCPNDPSAGIAGKDRQCGFSGGVTAYTPPTAVACEPSVNCRVAGPGMNCSDPNGVRSSASVEPPGFEGNTTSVPPPAT